MYHWKVFLWENGGKSTELTNYLIIPIYYEDRLDETLDAGEITLEGLSIETKNAFPPKTKFRLERYVTETCTDTPKTYDMIVDHDDVEEHVGEPSVCTHKISLIEVSAVAQGMHVDNFALTYELQDIDLNYKTTQTSEQKSISYVSPVQPASGQAIRQSDTFQYPITGTVIGGGEGNIGFA